MQFYSNQDHLLSISYFYISLWAAWGITNHGNFTFYSWLSHIVDTCVCHSSYMLVNSSMVCFDQWNVSKSMQNKIILHCKSQLACATVVLQTPDVEAFACRSLFHVFDENDKKVVLYNAFSQEHQDNHFWIYVKNVIQNQYLSSTSIKII